jgi:hypothetical protein
MPKFDSTVKTVYNQLLNYVGVTNQNSTDILDEVIAQAKKDCPDFNITSTNEKVFRKKPVASIIARNEETIDISQQDLGYVGYQPPYDASTCVANSLNQFRAPTTQSIGHGYNTDAALGGMLGGLGALALAGGLLAYCFFSRSVCGNKKKSNSSSRNYNSANDQGTELSSSAQKVKFKNQNNNLRDNLLANDGLASTNNNNNNNSYRV